MKLTAVWPGKDVDYCGKKIRDRKCDKNSMAKIDADLFKYNFCFTPSFNCKHGFYK